MESEERTLFQESLDNHFPADEEEGREDNHNHLPGGSQSPALFDADVDGDAGNQDPRHPSHRSQGDLEKYHRRGSDDWTRNENEELMSGPWTYGGSRRRISESSPWSQSGVVSERRSFSRRETGKELSTQAGAILVSMRLLCSKRRPHPHLCPLELGTDSFPVIRAYITSSSLFPSSS